ncbi:MAG TPA: ribosome small subunit-dependent GTPase A [Fibrobacteria bacterium]|nr:ribosome small subunit-dependent GTPase A [Fibrobacteria bacterium]
MEGDLEASRPTGPGSGTGHGPATPLLGTLVEVQRRTATVSGDDGDEYQCQYSPTIDLSGFSNFAVGDRVTFIRAGTQQEAMITGILPRTSKISRPGPKDRLAQELILAANVDALVVVTTPQKPDFNPRLVDRYLALAEIFGINAIICMNKADLDPSLPAELEYLATVGYPVVSVSAKQGRGMDELRKALEGLKVVLSGPSGVGKSSLIRKLIPDSDPGVGDVRKGDGKGRHTTTWSNLYRAGGICIIDTPGIRELGIRGVAKKELAGYWRDFRPFLQNCRFRDCAHKGEPGCAITEAVASGRLPGFRYQSFLRIQESMED